MEWILSLFLLKGSKNCKSVQNCLCICVCIMYMYGYGYSIHMHQRLQNLYYLLFWLEVWSQWRDDIILCLWLWLWWHFKFCMMQNNPSLPFLSLWIVIRNIMISCLIATLFFWMLTCPLPGVPCSSEFSLPGLSSPCILAVLLVLLL